MAMEFDVWFPEEQAMTLDQYRRDESTRKPRREVRLRSSRRNGERRA